MSRKHFNHNYDAKVSCRICGKEYNIPCNFADLEDFMKGRKNIQRALPYVPAELRELFLSEICPTCWDKIFKE